MSSYENILPLKYGSSCKHSKKRPATYNIFNIKGKVLHCGVKQLIRVQRLTPTSLPTF